jgi:hypothetical protein
VTSCNDIRIEALAPPAKRYRGKRARRAAFYGRQRIARLMTRLMNSEAFDEWHKAIDGAHLDHVLYGAGGVHVERIERRDDIDPMTGQPWAMPFRVRRMTRAEVKEMFGWKEGAT